MSGTWAREEEKTESRGEKCRTVVVVQLRGISKRFFPFLFSSFSFGLIVNTVRSRGKRERKGRASESRVEHDGEILNGEALSTLDHVDTQEVLHHDVAMLRWFGHCQREKEKREREKCTGKNEKKKSDRDG